MEWEGDTNQGGNATKWTKYSVVMRTRSCSRLSTKKIIFVNISKMFKTQKMVLRFTTGYELFYYFLTVPSCSQHELSVDKWHIICWNNLIMTLGSYIWCCWREVLTEPGWSGAWCLVPSENLSICFEPVCKHFHQHNSKIFAGKNIKENMFWPGQVDSDLADSFLLF